MIVLISRGEGALQEVPEELAGYQVVVVVVPVYWAVRQIV